MDENDAEIDLMSYCRPELRRFAKAMEDELRAAKNPAPTNNEMDIITVCILEEAQDLADAILGDKEGGAPDSEVKGLAASVANYAMYAWNIVEDNPADNLQ